MRRARAALVVETEDEEGEGEEGEGEESSEEGTSGDGASDKKDESSTGDAPAES